MSVRERAIDVMTAMWPNAPMLRDEAETVLDALERERLYVVARDPFARCRECGETVSGAITGPCNCGSNSWTIGEPATESER